MTDPSAVLRILGEALILASAKLSLDAHSASGVLSAAQPPDEPRAPLQEASRRLESASWLKPEEAADRLGVTKRWLVRRWRRLPFCHQLPGQARGFRVNARELEEAMTKRR